MSSSASSSASASPTHHVPSPTPAISGTYTNAHRAFLQSFLARGTLTYRQSKPILAAILSAHEKRDVLPEDITEADFSGFVNVVNKQVGGFDMQIRGSIPQYSSSSSRGDGERRREKVFALVNTNSDAVTQLATTHTADELAFVHVLLDGMFDKSNSTTGGREVMAVTGIQALNLVSAARRTSAANNQTSGHSAGREITGTSIDIDSADAATHTPASNLTKAQAQKLLDDLVAEGWFEVYKDHYVLSPRALMELRGWLAETYNEPADPANGVEAVIRVRSCFACREIVTVGVRCGERNCGVRLHEHCLGSLVRGAEGGRLCPGCRKKWTEGNFAGPKAAETGLRRSGGSGATSGGSRRRSGVVDDDDE